MTYKYFLIYFLFTLITGCINENTNNSKVIEGSWRLTKVNFSNAELIKYKQEVLDDFKRNERVVKETHKKKYPNKEFNYSPDSLANDYYNAIINTIDSGLFKIKISESKNDSYYFVKYNSLCNNHNGSIKIENDSIFVNEISSTEMGCSMDRIHSPFGILTTYSLNADTLILRNIKDKRILYYLRSDE